MIELFPASSLDSSIVTPVLIGVLWVWLLQETLGWGVSGLVVPGYLASIMVIQPETGGLIAVEGIITYAVVRALSENVPSWWPWSPFFGRDRFFHILLVSVAVRLALEAPGGLLDQLALRAEQPALGELNAMGLVLVPLVANSLWRAGLVLGIPRLGLPLLLTWGLLEFVLLPYTNLSLSSFELTYEDLALDFEGSAKAHLLLLVGAAVAAAVNLHWGWDMGGIIVPGLLTLVWLDPTKLTATLVEALVVAWALGVAVRLPLLRRLNLAGARTLVLGFLLDYLLRTVVAWTPWELTGLALAASDLQGFGYLLPTLVALRMHQHRQVVRVLVPVLLTSLVGFLVASALGYLLAVLSTPDASERPDRVRGEGLDHPLLQLTDAARRGSDRPPGTAGLLAQRGGEGVFALADGAGAIYVRPAAGQAAVAVGRLGALGTAQATWSLGELGDARAVLLCSGEGPGCTTALESLRSQGLELWVIGETSAAPSMSFRKRLSRGLTLGGVVQRFGTRETLAATPAQSEWSEIEPDLLLQLDTVARLHAAAQLFDEPQGSWAEALARPWEEDLEGQSAGPELEHVLDLLVLDPWMVWLETGAPDALEAARRAAPALGLQLAADGARSMLVAPSWRVLLDRGGVPVVVLVPERRHEPGAWAMAQALAHTVHAAALVQEMPSPHPLAVDERLRPPHRVLERVLDSLGPRADGAMGVLSLRGMRDLVDPDADVVLTLGRPVRPEESLPPVGLLAEKLVELAGAQVRWYDGEVEVIGLTDPGAPVRPLAAAALGAEGYVSMLTSTQLRDALSPVDAPDHPLGFLLREPGLARVEVDLGTLADTVVPGEGRLSPELASLVDELVRDGRAAGLARLAWQAGQESLDLELVCEPELGCRWLRLSRCAEGRCEGVLVPLHRDPKGEARAGDTVAALLVDGVDLPLAWQEAP